MFGKLMLTERLRELTAAGIIQRDEQAPAAVTYSLNDDRQLRNALRSLRAWAKAS